MTKTIKTQIQFIYEWKQTENHKEEVQKKECFVGMFMVPMP